VVQGDGLRQLRLGAIPPELRRHAVQAREHLAEAPRQPPGGLLERRRDRVAGGHHLTHEATEQHGVTCLINLLRGEKVLLLLAGGGVDVGGEVVGDRVLAMEEHRVRPQRAAPLDVRERPAPLLAVGAEVDLGSPPVALFPPAIEILVRDLIGCDPGGHC
jgi:hypothetical protein